MRFRTLPLAIPLLVAFCLAGGARADETSEESEGYDRFHASAGIGLDFNSGDYGEDERTDIYSSSVFVKLEYEPITVKVLVPYVVVDGPTIPGIGATPDPDDVESGTRHGIGDVVATLIYTYWPEQEYVPIVDVSTKVKIPSASSKEDIGTGHTDLTFGVEVTEVVDRVSVFGSAAYRIRTGGEFNNIWLVSVGTSLRLGRLASVGVAYDFREGSTDSSGESHEIAPFASFRLSEHWRFGPYGVFGLSTNSPDWGLGSTFTWKF